MAELHRFGSGGNWLGELIGDLGRLAERPGGSTSAPNGVPTVGVVRAQAIGAPREHMLSNSTRVRFQLHGWVRHTTLLRQGLPPPDNAFWRRPDVGQKVHLVVGALEAERTQFGAVQPLGYQVAFGFVWVRAGTKRCPLRPRAPDQLAKKTAGRTSILGKRAITITESKYGSMKRKCNSVGLTVIIAPAGGQLQAVLAEKAAMAADMSRLQQSYNQQQRALQGAPWDQFMLFGAEDDSTDACRLAPCFRMRFTHALSVSHLLCPSVLPCPRLDFPHCLHTADAQLAADLSKRRGMRREVSEGAAGAGGEPGSLNAALEAERQRSDEMEAALRSWAESSQSATAEVQRLQSSLAQMQSALGSEQDRRSPPPFPPPPAPSGLSGVLLRHLFTGGWPPGPSPLRGYSRRGGPSSDIRRPQQRHPEAPAATS